MSLDVIHPKDVPRGKIMFPKDEDASLKTNDIPKCRPTYEHLNYLDKPDMSVGCTDPVHAGGRARSYYAPMDRRPRDMSLTTADIELAQPRGVRHKGNRHTDPVCPNYQMPSAYKIPVTPPRFSGKHNMDNSDIEKSQPRILHPDRNYIRDPNEARDIEYTTPNYLDKLTAQRARPRADRSLNVKDISEPKRMRPRCTNPLDPVYTVPTNATTSLHAKYAEEHGLGIAPPRMEAGEAGHVEGSKPRKLTWDNGEPQLSLLREDIAGTVSQRWVGSVPTNIYDPPESRPMISFHDPHDIPGAQVGTLKKGIQPPSRCCNPLNPMYPMLDGVKMPQPVPGISSYESQRHPLLRNQAQASSMPNLRNDGRGITPGGRGMTPQQQGHMMPQQHEHGRMTPQLQQQQQQLDESMAMQQQVLAREMPSPAASQRSQRYEQPGSQRNYEPAYGPPGMQQQQTIRFDLPSRDGSQGMLSRRSMASSHGSLPRGSPQY